MSGLPLTSSQQWSLPRSVRSAVFILLASLVLLWPAYLNQKPFYMADSASYLRGGEFALRYAKSVVTANWSQDSASDESGDSGSRSNSGFKKSETNDFIGARTIAYSVFAALLKGPGTSLSLLIFGHAVLVASLIVVTFRHMGLAGNPYAMMGAITLISATTTTPWIVSFAMPDILAGIAILSAAVLTTKFKDLRWFEVLLLSGLLVFATASHASHIPLVAGLVLVCVPVALILYRHDLWRLRLKLTAWLCGSFVFALALITSTNLIGFGDVSVVAKRYPITLARYVADGPAREYLEESCLTDDYAVCEIFDEFPTTIGDFLWNENGLRFQASNEQMARIRAEEFLIIQRSMKEYPMSYVRLTIVDVTRQFMRFGLSAVKFGGEIQPKGQDDYGVSPAGKRRKEFKAGMEMIQFATLVVSFGVLVSLYLFARKSLKPEDHFMLLIVFLGLLGNAMVCAIFSGVTDRYQSRVIWVFPVVVVALALRIWLEQRSRRTQSV